MNTLFPVDPPTPPGFAYFPEFISKQDEQKLLMEISKIELHTFNFHGYEAKRRVAGFGYDNRSLSKGKEIPATFAGLIEKAALQAEVEKTDFMELLITEYPVGSVINWHHDALPFDVIAGFSMAADCVFRLRPHEKTKQTRASVISLSVNRRSLYVIQGPARSEWQHSITPVKAVRYSITLRTLKK